MATKCCVKRVTIPKIKKCRGKIGQGKREGFVKCGCKAAKKRVTVPQFKRCMGYTAGHFEYKTCS